MAFSLNQLILIGNLTADPELRYTPNGTAVVTFTVATNRRWRDTAGEWQEESEFTRCVAWRDLAERIVRVGGKGSTVHVQGRLQTREWQDRDGNRRFTTECIVTNFGLLIDRAGKTAMAPPAAGPTTPAPSTDGQEEVSPDEIPEVEVGEEKAAEEKTPQVSKKTPGDEDENGREEKKSQKNDIPF